ncbi:ankyrin repeat domain-containing protein [Epilithonimonas sp.]|uniref:ankyrin repeat domain-containing protein n=1 Tax=Epilithonimonas sp. TaxID=2894511 RepID=UPI0028A16D63|nr:ankyrin repeat domain-containing protein [Epilithonimonas sp.]
MKKILFTSFILLGMLFQAQKNTLLNADFWKAKPDVEKVKAEINQGNNPYEFNSNAFDPTALSINNRSSTDVIIYLLEKAKSVDQLTHDGRTYLHWAAMSGNKEVISYLLKKGYNPNKYDTKGFTPISFAAYFGLANAEIYDLFFRNGVDPKTKYNNDANILLLAIGNDKDGSLEKLFLSKGLSLDSKDNKGRTAFDYATSFGNIDILKSLRTKNIKATDYALINAASGTRTNTNGLPVYQYLLDDLKLNPKTTNEDGATALQIIARKPNQKEIIDYLINKGVDPNQKDADGNNALIIAAGGRDINNIKAILPKIKDINATNAKGESALTEAVKSSSAETIALLLDNKANINIKDIKGNDLAYHIIQAYNPAGGRGNAKDDLTEKMELLKSKGINFSTPQADGNTLLHLAIAKNNLDLLKKLEPYKIDVNAKNKESMTALHKAALIAKNDEILKYLISLGAKKDIKTEFDETAYDLASENEYLKKNNTSIEFLK